MIANKYSIGTLSTANHNEKTSVFARMNPLAEEKGSLYPQSTYFGAQSQSTEDRWVTNKVKALNDIEFESDEDWEEIKNLKRMPRTILNEENLKEFLSEETLRLNLENHYWIKNNMLDKIGRMAPNLQVLSLRRMKFITNPVFACIFKYLRQLQRVDLTDCLGLLSSACNLMLDHNQELSHIQLSGCTNAVNNEIMENISRLTETLCFLDVSYCKEITDEGINCFKDKVYPLDTLSINGCNGISGPGLR